MNNFYVYALRLANNPLPFYIGKGKGSRCKAHLEPRHLRTKSHKNHTILKALSEGIDVLIEIYYQGLPEDLAFLMERSYISHFGRRDLGSGCLTNLTDGGDGPAGVVPSAELIERRISKLRGVPRTEEAKQKMRKPKAKPRTPEHTEKHRQAILGRKASPEARYNSLAASWNRRLEFWSAADEMHQRWVALGNPKAHSFGKHYSLTFSQMSGLVDRFERGWVPSTCPDWTKWMSLQHCP